MNRNRGFQECSESCLPDCECANCKRKRKSILKSQYERKLKEHVRIRDGNKCQNPWCKSGKFLIKKGQKKLHTHHIEKNDDSFWMRISLCYLCHGIADNKDQQYWKNVYETIMKIKYFNFLINNL